MIRYCKEHCPRDKDGMPVAFEQLNALCRRDVRALEFAEEMTDCMEIVPKDYSQIWKTAAYCPHSEGATYGDADLTPADERDVRFFIQYLFEGITDMNELINQAYESEGADCELARSAMGTVIYSALNDALFRFIRTRFPKVLMDVDDLSVPNPLMKNKQKSRVWGAFNKIFIAYEADLLKTSDRLRIPRADAMRKCALHYLPGLFAQHANLCHLQMLADSYRVKSEPDTSHLPKNERLSPRPNITVMVWTKEEAGKGYKKTYTEHVHVTRSAPALTLGVKSSMRTEQTHKEKSVITYGSVYMHGHGREMCIEKKTTVPLTALFHPEHPTVLFAKTIARSGQYYQRFALDIIEHQGLSDILRMGSFVDEIIFVMENDPDKQSQLTFILPREGAEALGIGHEVMPVPEEYQEKLCKEGAVMPKDPVGVGFLLEGGEEEEPDPEPVPSDKDLVKV